MHQKLPHIQKKDSAILKSLEPTELAPQDTTKGETTTLNGKSKSQSWLDRTRCTSKCAICDRNNFKTSDSISYHIKHAHKIKPSRFCIETTLELFYSYIHYTALNGIRKIIMEYLQSCKSM